MENSWFFAFHVPFVLFPWIFTLVLSFCCATKISIFFFFLVFSFFFVFRIFRIFFHFFSFKWWGKFMVFCVSQVPTFVLFPWIFTFVLSFCCATRFSIFFFFLVFSFFLFLFFVALLRVSHNKNKKKLKTRKMNERKYGSLKMDKW